MMSKRILCPFCKRSGGVHELCTAKVLSKHFGLDPKVVRLPNGRREIGYEPGELIRALGLRKPRE